MQKRERALAALNGQEVDRPPLGFWFHFTGAEASGQACVDAHLRYYNHVDVDVAKIMCDGYFDYPHPVLKSAREPGELLRMEPLGAAHPFIREQVERAKLVKAGLKDELLVLYNLFAPFSLIRFATSDEIVMGFLRERPDALRYALDVIARDGIALGERLINEAEIDGAYFCLQGGEKDRMSAETYASTVAPSERKALDALEAMGSLTVLHLCGWAGIANNLSLWREYPGKAVNWAVHIENLPLKEGRAYFGDRCVLGGFDNRPGGLLCSGSQGEITALAQSLIRQAGPRSLILGADCTLPSGIALDRIRWVVEAAKSC